MNEWFMYVCMYVYLSRFVVEHRYDYGIFDDIHCQNERLQLGGRHLQQLHRNSRLNTIMNFQFVFICGRFCTFARLINAATYI